MLFCHHTLLKKRLPKIDFYLLSVFYLPAVISTITIYKKNPDHLSGLGHPAELNNIATDKKVPSHLSGLGLPAIIYKILLNKK